MNRCEAGFDATVVKWRLDWCRRRLFAGTFGRLSSCSRSVDVGPLGGCEVG